MNNFFNFSDADTNGGGFTVVPKATLAWATVNIKPGSTFQVETVSSNNTNNSYLDLELIICEGKYAKAKINDRPGVKGESDTWVNKGRAAIRAMLETGKGASQSNPDGYKIDSFSELHGLKVAIKIGVEEGTGGYGDKNIIMAYLSPNPDSSTHKDFKALQDGNVSAPVNTEATSVKSTQSASPTQEQVPVQNETPAWLQNQ